MKSLAASFQPTLETSLTILTGPDKGTVYRVVSSRVSIGRGNDNDIVIADDNKCSRHHAELVWTPQGFEVRNISEKNSLVVNGQECDRALLSDSTQITLGDTVLRFTVRAEMPAPVLAAPVTMVAYGQGGNSPAGFPAPAGGVAAPLPRPAHKRRPKSGGSPMRWIIVGIIGLILWIGVSQNAAKKRELVKLRTEDQINADIREAEQLRNKIVADSQKSNSDFSFQQAQQAYVSGFRDYRKGQYERAISYFQACLSLNSGHELCKKYLPAAQKKFDELVQLQMVLGHNYRDQNQFAACRSAYRNVMTMVKDPNSSTYKEAKANFEVCDARLEGRY